MKNVTSVPVVQSKFLVSQPSANGTIAYHALYGRPELLNAESMAFLQLFTAPRTLESVRQECSIEDDTRWLNHFLRRHFLHRADIDERKSFQASVARAVKASMRPSEFMSLGLVLDEGCNFDCSHCVAKKLLKATNRSAPAYRRMSWPMAKKAIDTFIVLMRQRRRDRVEVFFGGSEPFLNWSVFERAVLYCHEQYGQEFTFTFFCNSNASLINPERASFLVQHGVTVSTSLDGLPDTNDLSRVTATGRGTYRRIIRGWNNLGRAGQPVQWCSLTLTDKNIDRIDESFFDWLVERKITACTFENDLIAPLLKTPEELVEVLMRFKTWGDQRKISVGGLWDKPFRNLFEPLLRNRLFSCSAFSGQGTTVLPNGDLVLCVYSATKLGTIADFERLPLTAPFQKVAGEQSVGNIPECQGCEIEGQCMGGCYLTPEYGRATHSDLAFKYRCNVLRGATRALLQRTVGAQ